MGLIRAILDFIDRGDYTVTRVDLGNNCEAEILDSADAVEMVAWNKNKSGEHYFTRDKDTGKTTHERFG